MSAAVAAREFGAGVVVLDEYPRLGGQFYKRASREFQLRPGQLSAEHSAGETLRAKVERLGIEVWNDTIVWGAFDRRLMVYRQGRSSALDAGAIVVATGGHDRPYAFPGWTLPGVMTAGGAQTLARTQWVKPGSRVLIAGAGPFCMPVAQQVLRTGARIVAIVEATQPREWLAYAGSLRGQWSRFREAFGYWRTLRGVPVLFGHKLVRAVGGNAVEAADVAAVDNQWRIIPGTDRRFEVDAIATAYGFLPNIEVADGLGCELEWDPYGTAWFVRRDARMATSVPGVFAAGEITGIAGSAVAIEEGRIAGMQAAVHVEVASSPAVASKCRQAQARLRHLMRFADALNRLFGPRPGLWEGLEDDTTVCRCEDVTAGQIRACVRSGCTSIKSVKDWTRAGMGPCQGRICRSLVGQIIASESRVSLASLQRPRVRPPFKPVPLGAMAETEV